MYIFSFHSISTLKYDEPVAGEKEKIGRKLFIIIVYHVVMIYYFYLWLVAVVVVDLTRVNEQRRRRRRRCSASGRDLCERLRRGRG